MHTPIQRDGGLEAAIGRGLSLLGGRLTGENTDIIPCVCGYWAFNGLDTFRVGFRKPSDKPTSYPLIRHLPQLPALPENNPLVASFLGDAEKSPNTNAKPCRRSETPMPIHVSRSDKPRSEYSLVGTFMQPTRPSSTDAKSHPLRGNLPRTLSP